MIYTKLRIMWIFTMFAIGFLTAAVFGGASTNEARAKYEKSISVTARALKDVYEPNEPVTLMVAIANHSSEPVYLSTDKPDIFSGSARVKDANGVNIMGDPIPTPPPPPGYYYMKKDGKRIYTVPLSKIDGPGVILAVMPDALKLHHKHLREGTYYLDMGDIEIIHKVSSLIVREDVPHRLWVEPQSPMTKVRHKLNTIKIQIQESTAERPQIFSFAWPPYLLGALAGMGALYLVLLLKKKASSRGK